MRSKPYIIVFLYLLPVIGFSQTQIGLKSGYNYFFIIDTGNDKGHYHADYYPNRLSFCTSLSISQQLTNSILQSVEIEYLNIAFKVQSKYGGLAGGGHADYSYSIGYLSLSFLPKLIFGERIKFLLGLGLKFSFLANSHVTGSNFSWSIQPAYDTTYFDGTAKGQIVNPSTGIVLSLGVSIPLVSSLDLEIENYNSIYFHNSAQNTMWGGGCNFLNMNLSIGILYTLPVNKQKEKKRHNKPAAEARRGK